MNLAKRSRRVKDSSLKWGFYFLPGVEKERVFNERASPCRTAVFVELNDHCSLSTCCCTFGKPPPAGTFGRPVTVPAQTDWSLSRLASPSWRRTSPRSPCHAFQWRRGHECLQALFEHIQRVTNSGCCTVSACNTCLCDAEGLAHHFFRLQKVFERSGSCVGRTGTKVDPASAASSPMSGQDSS